jgi:GTP-binding protein HflX
LKETQRTTQSRERAVLVGLCRDSRERKREEESLEELAELASSADAEVADALLQERATPDPAYLIGAGKLDELRESVVVEQADLVIFNEDLTPAQLRNLERSLDTKVVDRSELILDIFAQRARSREGKLQVELAQLDYLLPRLTGKGVELSRLGGGIGTRGPGETRLEVDRRRIRARMARLREELGRLETRRHLQRRKRRGVPIPTVSLVGYTNAGKSSLFNRLTKESAYVSRRMFATLDPLVRRLSLDSGHEVLISDTVGFVRRLPHTLVAAFHATLEETVEADLILHVIDVSQENYSELRAAVYEVLEEIGLREAEIVEVYNKVDLLQGPIDIVTPYAWALVSAKTGEGIEPLLAKISELLSRRLQVVDLLLPLDRGDIVAQLRERAHVEKEEYTGAGIHLRAALAPADQGRFEQFIIKPESHVSSRNCRKAKRRKVQPV